MYLFADYYALGKRMRLQPSSFLWYYDFLEQRTDFDIEKDTVIRNLSQFYCSLCVTPSVSDPTECNKLLLVFLQ